MLIRKMNINDVASLSELYRQFWNEASDTEKMRAKFLELDKRDDYILLCAVEGERLTGSVMGIVCEELYGECMPFLVIENMVVDRTYRKKGVGRQLLLELEKEAMARKCRQAILVTENNRSDARGFYESMGFHPTANKGYKKKLWGIRHAGH